MTWTELLDADNDEILEDGILEDLMSYLKIDAGDDDAVLIQCVRAAIRYIINSVDYEGDFPDDDEEAKHLLYVMAQDLYDSRELMQSDIQQKKSRQYTYSSMLLQLQLINEDSSSDSSCESSDDEDVEEVLDEVFGDDD